MDNNEEKEEIQFEKELNQEILNWIFDMYDETFKDLVNR